jgi:hypothetical protein
MYALSATKTLRLRDILELSEGLATAAIIGGAQPQRALAFLDSKRRKGCSTRRELLMINFLSSEKFPVICGL